MKEPDGNSIEARMISQSRCHAIVREDVGIFPYSHMTSGLTDPSESKVIYGQKPSTETHRNLQVQRDMKETDGNRTTEANGSLFLSRWSC